MTLTAAAILDLSFPGTFVAGVVDPCIFTYAGIRSMDVSSVDKVGLTNNEQFITHTTVQKVL
jgi:hypothetical protein